jgi:hypothetical protein
VLTQLAMVLAPALVWTPLPDDPLPDASCLNAIYQGLCCGQLTGVPCTETFSCVPQVVSNGEVYNSGLSRRCWHWPNFLGQIKYCSAIRPRVSTAPASKALTSLLSARPTNS